MFTAIACLVLATSPLQLQDQALLDDLSYKAFRFFWEQSNVLTGFTKDRASNLGSPDSNTLSSIAATGYSLAAYAIGWERGYISRQSALLRTKNTLLYLQTTAPKEHGWFYHFIHWQTGARMGTSEVSSIDTAILVAGMLLAERSFKDSTVTSRVNSLVSAIDWNWMLTDGGTKPNSLTFSMGWTPESGFIPYRWDTYSEEMMLLVQALGASPSVPSGVWTAFSRPMITYANWKFIQGGPLFMHQMSHGFLDFKDKVDPLKFDYWTNSKSMTLASRKYCINNPHHFTAYGPNFWGLSAGDTPDGYKALGGPGWGEDNGTIIPTSAIASVMFTPAESIAAANHLYVNYNSAYGRYGFSNGLNPGRNWIDNDVIGIDLGMMLLGIENHRNGMPNKRSMEHPINSTGFSRIKFKYLPPAKEQAKEIRGETGCFWGRGRPHSWLSDSPQPCRNRNSVIIWE